MKKNNSLKEDLSSMLGEINDKYIYEAYLIDTPDKFQALDGKKTKLLSKSKNRIIWRFAIIAAIFIITASMSILASDDILELFKINVNENEDEGFFLSGTISGSGNGGSQAPVTSRDPSDYINNDNVVSNIEWTISENGVMMFMGTGEIPNYPEQKTPWFHVADKVTSVIISDGITRVGDFAFDHFVNMESITIPPSIKSFGIMVFTFCPKIESVYISDMDAWCRIQFEGYLSNPLSYGTETDTIYLNKKPITEVTVPNDVKYLDYTFTDFRQLEKVVLPEGLERIGDSAFSGCHLLKTVNIPNTVTEIGSFAFGSCYSLESITIPDSVTLIEFGAFGNRCGIKSIKLSENLTTIYGSTFGHCENLVEIVIPKSVETIERNAFGSCKNLEKVTLFGNTSIHKDAFLRCPKLKKENIIFANE